MKKLLVVDDNTVMLRIYEFHLGKKDWEGQYFEKGGDAINILAEIEPDVAILDYDLKDMMGTDVYEAMRKAYPDKNIPVIFITAQIRSDIRNSLMELDNASILAKPFSPAHLVKAIEDILGE